MDFSSLKAHNHVTIKCVVVVQSFFLFRFLGNLNPPYCVMMMGDDGYINFVIVGRSSLDFTPPTGIVKRSGAEAPGTSRSGFPNTNRFAASNPTIRLTISGPSAHPKSKKKKARSPLTVSSSAHLDHARFRNLCHFRSSQSSIVPFVLFFPVSCVLSCLALISPLTLLLLRRLPSVIVRSCSSF